MQCFEREAMLIYIYLVLSEYDSLMGFDINYLSDIVDTIDPANILELTELDDKNLLNLVLPYLEAGQRAA